MQVGLHHKNTCSSSRTADCTAARFVAATDAAWTSAHALPLHSLLATLVGNGHCRLCAEKHDSQWEVVRARLQHDCRCRRQCQGQPEACAAAAAAPPPELTSLSTLNMEW